MSVERIKQTHFERKRGKTKSGNAKRAHFREKRGKICPDVAAGHWNLKNSVREKRNLSDEVTAAIRRIARNRKGPHHRPAMLTA